MYSIISVLHSLLLLAPLACSEHLILVDNGVGHRSNPVKQWPTSLRRLNTDGTSASKLHEFGDPTPYAQPIGASSIAITNNSIYTATGEGIIRTDLTGAQNLTIIPERAECITIFDNHIYYGVQYEGLIKRAFLNGSNIEPVLNVSQGINYNIIPSYTPANAYPTGIAIDPLNGFIYWSASRGDDEGSIRRVALRSIANTTDPDDVEVLVENISMPGQLRIVLGYVYWVEEGRWYNSATSIKRARFPASRVTESGGVEVDIDVIVSSTQSAIFYEVDTSGDNNTLAIRSFAIDERSGRLWFAMESSLRVMWARVVRVWANGSGGLQVLNQDTGAIGIPVGVEFVR